MWKVVLAVVAVTWAVRPTTAQVPSVPQLEDEWWGPEEARSQSGCQGNDTIVPFTVIFSEEMIEDLKYRLKNHRAVVPPLQGVAFQYGFNQKQIAPWVQYWSEQYNFREREQAFNKFPQYKTNVQGLDIHFIWVKPQVAAGVKTVPLLLLHGWPGSVHEFYEAIPLLTTPTDGLVFEVIVPSLPGFGFSDGAVRPGMGVAQVAVVLKNLMLRLGHRRFFVQGGDLGAITGNVMATMYPGHVLGLHSNQLMSMSNSAELQTIMTGVTAAMQKGPIDTATGLVVEETGYLHLLATKPDTVGNCLSDSPVALLCFILEKFSTWTNVENRALEDGGLSRFSKDQLLDNLMVYWSSNCITTSVRIYAETWSADQRGLRIDEYPAKVPIWKLEAENEKIFYQAPSVLKHPYLLGVTRLPDAGHFVAFEKPGPFAEDVFGAVHAFMHFHDTRRTEL